MLENWSKEDLLKLKMTLMSRKKGTDIEMQPVLNNKDISSLSSTIDLKKKLKFYTGNKWRRVKVSALMKALDATSIDDFLNILKNKDIDDEVYYQISRLYHQDVEKELDKYYGSECTPEYSQEFDSHNIEDDGDFGIPHM